jgi:AbiV family abortive infection protein
MKTRKKAEEAPVSGKRSIKIWVLTLYSACLKNAGDLMEEAEILLKHKHAARAYFLGYTAIEELGKSQVVADYFYDLVTEAEFEAAFREHTFKAAYINRYVQIPQNLGDEWFIEYDKAAARRHVADRARALYIERKQDNTPQTPNEVITIDEAKSIVAAGRKYFEEIIRMEHMTECIGTKAFTK